MKYDTPTGHPEFAVTFGIHPIVDDAVKTECQHAIDDVSVATLEQATDTIDDILIGYGYRSCSFEVAEA